MFDNNKRMPKSNGGVVRGVNGGVNIGLTIAIILLFILIICLACFTEGFKNVLPDYKIPYVGENIPSLQKLTTPLFPDRPMEPVATEEAQVKSMDDESIKIIKEAQGVVNGESDKILQRREYLQRQRVVKIKPLRRVNPRAKPKPKTRKPVGRK